MAWFLRSQAITSHGRELLLSKYSRMATELSSFVEKNLAEIYFHTSGHFLFDANYS